MSGRIKVLALAAAYPAFIASPAWPSKTWLPSLVAVGALRLVLCMFVGLEVIVWSHDGWCSSNLPPSRLNLNFKREWNLDQLP